MSVAYHTYTRMRSNAIQDNKNPFLEFSNPREEKHNLLSDKAVDVSEAIGILRGGCSVGEVNEDSTLREAERWRSHRWTSWWQFSCFVIYGHFCPSLLLLPLSCGFVLFIFFFFFFTVVRTHTIYSLNKFLSVC